MIAFQSQLTMNYDCIAWVNDATIMQLMNWGQVYLNLSDSSHRTQKVGLAFVDSLPHHPTCPKIMCCIF